MTAEERCQVITFEVASFEKKAGHWQSNWDIAKPEDAAAAMWNCLGAKAVLAAAQCALAALRDGRELDCEFWWSIHTILWAAETASEHDEAGARSEPEAGSGAVPGRNALDNDADPLMARLINGDPDHRILCISEWGDPLEAAIIGLHLLKDPLCDITHRARQAQETGRAAEAAFWRRVCTYVQFVPRSENQSSPADDGLPRLGGP